MKKRSSAAPLIIVLCLLVLLTGGLLFLYFFPKEKAPVGIWERRLDVSENVRNAAKEWLSEAVYGERIDLAFEDRGPALTLILSFDTEGNWERHIDRTSYDAARGEAARAFEEAVRELFSLRIEAAGQEAMTQEEIDRAFEDEFGISLAEYLSEYGPALLPEYDELAAAYEKNGSYRVEDGLLIRGSSGEPFLFNDTMLVIYESGGEEATVYEKQKNAE